MTFEELKFRLGWFSDEAGFIDRARGSLARTQADVEALSFDLGPYTKISDFGGCVDELLSALVHEEGTSIATGVDRLQAFEDGIRETGRNYLIAESEGESYGHDLQRLVEEEGL